MDSATDSQRPAGDWISVRELARRRGRHHRAAQTAIERGLIPAEAVERDASGRVKRVNADVALLAWQGTLSGGPPSKPLPGTLRGKAPAAAVPEETRKYYENRAKREDYRARKDELDYRVRAGELLEAADVAKRMFDGYRIVRERFLNFANRVAPLVLGIAPEADPGKVHRLLDAEVKRMLDEVASDVADGRA